MHQIRLKVECWSVSSLSVVDEVGIAESFCAVESQAPIIIYGRLKQGQGWDKLNFIKLGVSMRPSVGENEIEALLPVDWKESELLDGSIEQIFSAAPLPMLSLVQENMPKMVVESVDAFSEILFDEVFESVEPVNLEL